MRLTVYTDYALRLLMYVAQRPDRLCTIAEVAQAYRVSEAHLMKITHHLGRGGFLETVRGKGGGMRLAMAPSEINIGTLVRQMETDIDLVECFETGNNACQIMPACVLRGALHQALGAFLAVLDKYTLADLLRPKAELSRLLTPSA